MKKIRIIGMTLALTVSSQAATTIFSSDMGNATVANVAAGDLNGVSTGGTWAVNFAEVNTSSIVANADSTDYALLVDEGSQGGSAQGTNAILNLGTNVDFSSTIDIQFDMAYSRSGAGKSLAMIGYAADDTTEIFRLNWDLSNGTTPITGVANPTNLVIGTLPSFASSTNPYDPSSLQTFNVTLDGTALTYAASGLTSQTTTILNSGTELSSIKWEITGASANAQGFWLDNVSVETVPEPSSLALIGLGSLALILRRRK